MIRQELYIEPYGWHVVVYYAVDGFFADQIVTELRGIKADEEFVGKAYKNMTDGNLDTGFTYSNLVYGESIMVINGTSSQAQFDNSLNHERQHLIMHIAQKYNMDVYCEEICYLAGGIAMQMHPVTKNLVSECGCHSHDVAAMIKQAFRRIGGKFYGNHFENNAPVNINIKQQRR